MGLCGAAEPPAGSLESAMAAAIAQWGRGEIAKPKVLQVRPLGRIAVGRIKNWGAAPQSPLPSPIQSSVRFPSG